MNGPPVCPGRKTENAPTWRSPSPLFGGLFLAYFGAYSGLLLNIPTTNPISIPAPVLPSSIHPTVYYLAHLFYLFLYQEVQQWYGTLC